MFEAVLRKWWVPSSGFRRHTGAEDTKNKESKLIEILNNQWLKN